jgi:hypothetical protein
MEFNAEGTFCDSKSVINNAQCAKLLPGDTANCHHARFPVDIELDIENTELSPGVRDPDHFVTGRYLLIQSLGEESFHTNWSSSTSESSWRRLPHSYDKGQRRKSVNRHHSRR